MRRTLLMLVTIVTSLFASTLLAQAPPQSHFDGKTWWEHGKILADDNMEGRETGSEGLRRAQTYVAYQLKKSGLEPAGSDGYNQSVKFIERQVDEAKSGAALVYDGKSLALVPGDDILFSSKSNTGEKEITAPLVFAGYGLKI